MIGTGDADDDTLSFLSSMKKGGSGSQATRDPTAGAPAALRMGSMSMPGKGNSAVDAALADEDPFAQFQLTSSDDEDQPQHPLSSKHGRTSIHSPAPKNAPPVDPEPLHSTSADDSPGPKQAPQQRDPAPAPFAANKPALSWPSSSTKRDTVLAAAALRLSPLPAAATKAPAPKQQTQPSPAATGAATSGPMGRPQSKQVFSLSPVNSSFKASSGPPVPLASYPAVSGSNRQPPSAPGSAAGRALQPQSLEDQAMRRQQGGQQQQQLNPLPTRSLASVPSIVRGGGALMPAGPPLTAKALPKIADVSAGASAAAQKPALVRAAPISQTSQMLVDSSPCPIGPGRASSANGQNGLHLKAASPPPDVIPSPSSAAEASPLEAEIPAAAAHGEPAPPQIEAEAPKEAEGGSLLPMDAAPASDGPVGCVGQGGPGALVAEQFPAAPYSPQLHAAAAIPASAGENGDGLGPGSGDILAAAEEEQPAAPALKRARAFEPDSPSAEVPMPDDYLKSIHTLEMKIVEAQQMQNEVMELRVLAVMASNERVMFDNPIIRDQLKRMRVAAACLQEQLKPAISA